MILSFIKTRLVIPEVISRFSILPGGGGLAQWLGARITDQGIPGSSPGRGVVRCGLGHVKFTPCLILVKHRKRWTYNRLEQTVTRLETTLSETLKMGFLMIWLKFSLQGFVQFASIHLIF